MIPSMDYFLALVIGGLLSAPIYAVIAVAFVTVFRAAATFNFSLGEWVSLGGRLTGVGTATVGLPVWAAIPAAIAAMTALAALFNRLVIRKLTGQQVVAAAMATLALAALMQAGATLTLKGLPAAIPAPFANEVIWVADAPVPLTRLVAALAALAAVFAAFAFFRYSRKGVAMRAVSDDPTAAAAAGIDVTAILTLAWAISGALAVVGGVLWSMEGLGGFGMGLTLAKVLPAVVIGGLTSFGGALVGALLVGLVESLAAGYLDPMVGAGSGHLMAALLVPLTLAIRPTGLFGDRAVARV